MKQERVRHRVVVVVSSHVTIYRSKNDIDPLSDPERSVATHGGELWTIPTLLCSYVYVRGVSCALYLIPPLFSFAEDSFFSGNEKESARPRLASRLRHGTTRRRRRCCSVQSVARHHGRFKAR